MITSAIEHRRTATWLVGAAVAGFVFAWLPPSLAALFLLALIIGFLTITQPLVGLGLALLAGPLGALEQHLRSGFGYSLLDSGQLLLLLALAAWLARGLIRQRLSVPRTFLNVPLLLFIGVAALSLLGADALTPGIQEVIKWLEVALIIWMVTDLGRERPAAAIKLIVLVLLLAGLGQALLGIWQFALAGDGPEHFLVLGRYYRAFGSFEQPNPFGGFMSLMASLALGLVIGLSRRHRANSWGLPWLLFSAVCATAMLLALLFSWSRGAWLGFSVAAAVFLLGLSRRPLIGLLVAAFAALLFALAWQADLVPPAVAARLTSFTADFQLGDVRGVDINDENYAVLERLAHWQAALGMARQNPWLGIGFGNYEAAYSRYALINWPIALGHAHNYYLNLLAEVGILGLAAYLLFWLAVYWQTGRVLVGAGWPERGLALGLLAAWSGLSAHHLVDMLYVNNLYLHIGAMLGLLQLLESQELEKVGLQRKNEAL